MIFYSEEEKKRHEAKKFVMEFLSFLEGIERREAESEKEEVEEKKEPET